MTPEEEAAAEGLRAFEQLRIAIETATKKCEAIGKQQLLLNASLSETGKNLSQMLPEAQKVFGMARDPTNGHNGFSGHYFGSYGMFRSVLVWKTGGNEQ